MITYEINSHDSDFNESKKYLDILLEEKIQLGEQCQLTETHEHDMTMCSHRISYKYTFNT